MKIRVILLSPWIAVSAIMACLAIAIGWPLARLLGVYPSAPPGRRVQNEIVGELPPNRRVVRRDVAETWRPSDTE